MAQRVGAVFADWDAARHAAEGLVELGADRDKICILSRGEAPSAPLVESVLEPPGKRPTTRTPIGGHGSEEQLEQAAEEAGALKSALAGGAAAVLTGGAVGLASLVIPGIGPILAAGIAIASGLGAGIYTGLRTMDFQEEQAHRYEERLRGGAVLLIATVPDELDHVRIKDTLGGRGAEDVALTSGVPDVPPTMAPEGAAPIRR